MISQEEIIEEPEVIEQPSSLFASQAITAFSIISGVATGIATLYLSNKFKGGEVTSTSVATAIIVSAIATVGSAFLIKEITQK